MDILSITNKSSVSADAKVYTKDGNDFVTTTFDALYNKSSAKTNIEKSVSDANARIDKTNNTVAELDNYARTKANGIVLQSQGKMVTVNDSSDDYVVNLKPYGKSEQDEEPSPDYPQEIRSTVISEVRSCGAQLLNYNAWKTVGVSRGTAVFENNGVTITATDNDACTNSAPGYIPEECYIEVSEGETINLSWEEDTNTSGLVYIFGNGANDSMVTVNNSTAKKLSYTVPSEITFVTFRFGVAKSGKTISYKNIMIDKRGGLPYEPYTETVATLSEPITLYGIPTDSDGNFTDSNGQNWIADYIDVVKGKVVRNVKEFDLSEITGWNHTEGWGNKSCFASNVEFSDIVNVPGYHINANIMCNRLIVSNSNNIAQTEAYGIAQAYQRLFVAIEGITTSDDLIAYFDENETIVHYPLATPTEEDLPTADIVALKNLKTFYNITHVMNDSEVKGETVLFYNADTKMYIDNKFAELAAQLV